MNQVATTRTQREILRHALGLSSYKGQEVGRNWYCVEVGSPDEAAVFELIRLGLMLEGRSINDGRDWYAHVTEAGKREVGA